MECCTREFDFWVFYQFYTMKSKWWKTIYSSDVNVNNWWWIMGRFHCNILDITISQHLTHGWNKTSRQIWWKLEIIMTIKIWIKNIGIIILNIQIFHLKIWFVQILIKLFVKEIYILNNSKNCVLLNLNGLDGILIWKIIYKKSWKCILVGWHKNLH
jgi:hypothetical protein